MAQATHFQQLGKTGEILGFDHIDPDIIGLAISEMTRIADAHAVLLQHDLVLAGAIVHYENLLIEAQSGDAAALKRATDATEFDKLLELAHEKNVRDEDLSHDGARDSVLPPQESSPELHYLALQKDLMAFRHRFLPGSQPPL